MNRENNKDEQGKLEQIMAKLDAIEGKLDRINKVNEVLDGDKMLDNQDLCLLLGITKRTLQRYRHLKKITYYKIDGRTCYRTSDVKKFLENFEVRSELFDKI